MEEIEDMIYLVSDDTTWLLRNAQFLRQSNIACNCVYGRSVKAQLRYAKKMKATQIVTTDAEIDDLLAFDPMEEA